MYTDDARLPSFANSFRSIGEIDVRFVRKDEDSELGLFSLEVECVLVVLYCAFFAAYFQSSIRALRGDTVLSFR